MASIALDNSNLYTGGRQAAQPSSAQAAEIAKVKAEAEILIQSLVQEPFWFSVFLPLVSFGWLLVWAGSGMIGRAVMNQIQPRLQKKYAFFTKDVAQKNIPSLFSLPQKITMVVMSLVWILGLILIVAMFYEYVCNGVTGFLVRTTLKITGNDISGVCQSFKS